MAINQKENLVVEKVAEKIQTEKINLLKKLLEVQMQNLKKDFFLLKRKANYFLLPFIKKNTLKTNI